MSEPSTLKMLVGSDLHNSRPGLEWFGHLAGFRHSDLIVFLGDFVTQGPLQFVREALATLRTLSRACFVIPGNWDPREALVELDTAAYDGLRNLHKTAAGLGGYRFAGLGGSITTPVGDTPLEASDIGFASPLKPLLPANVWVLHNPVNGHRDLTAGKSHVGSHSLADVWWRQEAKPRLVLSGHIHEAAGWESAAGTTFVNPGSLANRSAAWVELSSQAVSVEMLGG
jgi:hypothetical protein